MNQEKKQEQKPTIRWEQIFSLAPVIGLILVIIFYVVVMTRAGIAIDAIRIRSIVGNIIMTAIVAIGAVYAFAGGALDMSMSGSVCCTAIIGALVCRATNSVVAMFVACMAAAILFGVIKGVLASYMHVPVFIVTIVLGTMLSSLGAVLMGNETTISLSSYFQTTPAGVVYTGIGMVLIFYVVAMVLFNYTKVGKSIKLLGGNPKSATQSGISANQSMIIAFIVGGVAVGLAAIFAILQTKTITQATGGSLGNDMMVAVVLGGMPLSGGSKSRISAALIGSATITILNTALTVMGLTVGYIQIVRGILFLGVVFVTSMAYRGKLLPR